MSINLDAIQGPPVAFHKLNRAQLLTLAIALQDQRDDALAYARDLEAQVKRYAEQDADAFVNLQVTESQAKLRAKVDDLEARIGRVEKLAEKWERTPALRRGTSAAAIRAALTATEDRA